MKDVMMNLIGQRSGRPEDAGGEGRVRRSPRVSADGSLPDVGLAAEASVPVAESDAEDGDPVVHRQRAAAEQGRHRPDRRCHRRAEHRTKVSVHPSVHPFIRSSIHIDLIDETGIGGSSTAGLKS